MQKDIEALTCSDE